MSKKDEIKNAIRNAVVQLSKDCGIGAENVDDDCVIPEARILDSSSIIELVIWLEMHFSIEIPQDEVTMDNLGSINQMADYVIKKTL